MDDHLVSGSCKKDNDQFKVKMKLVFEMTSLGKLSYFLGMKFLDTSMGVIMHQEMYANEILTIFNILECNSAITPSDKNLKFEEPYASEEDNVDATTFRKSVG